MAALGRPGYINLDRQADLGGESRSIEKMQTQANVVMDRLFELTAKNKNDKSTSSSSSLAPSLPWLDCARSYGYAERFTGEYLRSNNVAPEDVYVSSKWGYTYVADWKVELGEGEPHEIKDHSLENFLKQIKETEEFIGEYVNLYQVHSATLDSGILSNKEVHEAMAKCRKERGWKLGLSVSGPQQNDVLRQARTLKDEDGNFLFDSVQCTFNVLEQRPQEALQEAHDAGMDIIIKEGLANGRALRNKSVIKFAEQLGCKADQLALACILAQPFEPRVLSGSVLVEHLDSNFEAVLVAQRIKDDPDLLEYIMDGCVMDSEEYWKDRAALAWN